MTGFGRSQAYNEEMKITVEIKSVNHRYIETIVRLPRKYSILEEKVKNTIRNHIHRGRIEVWISVEELTKTGTSIKVDKDLAIDYYNSLKELADLVDICPQIELKDLYSLEGVIILEEEEANLDDMWNKILKPLKESIEQLIAMREQEGGRLSEDLKARKEIIEDMLADIEKRNPEVVNIYKERLQRRIDELVDDKVEIDQNRLSTEVALFADKSDITEEVVRLKSHIKQVVETVSSAKPVGRKLDFIMQEMHREANTIGSKSTDAVISEKVVEVKSEIEKMREQVQNVE